MSQNYESFGKYILLEKIAAGGMAEVYLARNSGAGGIGKFLALKRILPQYSENSEFIEMFKDEAKIAVNLSHSNIVSIYEFGVERKQFFLVMDYVEGRNLRQILNKMKKSNFAFSIEQVLYIIKEVAAGLDHAHRCLDANTGKPLNIIHRDMSPQNIMVNFEGEVKIVDFGIAKAETQIETTRAGTLKGKFGYMSPEQAEGGLVDLRTDIFSLGIVLWELLASDRLFVANNEVNTLRKIRDCQVPSLRNVNPNISPELERIVSKALAKDRNLRYQTAAELHRELSRFLNRHYPDFSPQDFSAFIKTLFASDILDWRKKMVEFAKLEAQGKPSTTTTSRQDLTVVTATHDDLPPAGSPISYSADIPAPDIESLKRPQTGEDKASALRDKQSARLQIQKPLTLREPVSGPAPQSHPKIRIYNRGQSPRQELVRSLLIAVVVFGGAYTAFEKRIVISETLQRYGIYSPPKLSAELSSEDKPTKFHYVSVTSSPSGAEIYIDDIPIREVTPARIPLEAGKAFKIKVRIDETYSEFEETLQVTGPRSINARLQELQVGFLDVRVVGNGAIAINGMVVANRSPASQVRVPAGQDIKVTAYDPVTGAGAEAVVRVDKNMTKTVTLVPRAGFLRRSESTQKK